MLLIRARALLLAVASPLAKAEAVFGQVAFIDDAATLIGPRPPGLLDQAVFPR